MRNPRIGDARQETPRLPGFDYRQARAYFITFNTHRWWRLLGTVVQGRLVLSEAGRMVEEVIDDVPSFYAGVAVDRRVVMPDHVHLILTLTAADGTPPALGSPWGLSAPAASRSVPDIVQRIKTLTTRRYINGVRERGWTPFPGRLWHRSYHDRIIRDVAALEAIRRYIERNPARWRR